MLENPHWGNSLDPFMKRRTGLLSTRDWILAWVGLEEMLSSSAIWSAVILLMEEHDCCAVVSDDAAGANAVVHDADDRRAVAKRIGRIMVSS